ncbi:hypothetical protein BDZ89DRAFT_1027699 [Hymenopellis radicata]|nr:hypothetical protein BDZ89DRAFT_1027699 [Hymenopellis radicata]
MISPQFVAECMLYARAHAQVPAGKSKSSPSSASSTSDPYTVSKDEAMFYYGGMSPSAPKLVYRTGSSKTPWVKPPGYRRLKQARGVFGHKLNAVWNDVGPLVRDLLNTHNIFWTSIDVVRFITEGDTDGLEDGGEEIHGPVIIWIGVYPASLQGEDAFRSSNQILDLLAGFDIDDVEVEFRESIYKQSAGPALLRSVGSVCRVDNTADVCGPLTPALGLSIATSDRPTTQGTMALYFVEGGDSNKVLGLTCHHVLFETDDEYVLAHDHDASRRHVQLLGTDAFNDLLSSIKIRIGCHGIIVGLDEAQIQRLEAKVGGDDDAGTARQLKVTRRSLKDTNAAIEDLEKFYDKVKKDWSKPDCRTIGHIRLSPAIAVGVEGFTEDWGAFELDTSKFKDAFQGNAIHLRSEKLSSSSFILKMRPCTRGQKKFKYPADHLLPLHDIITREDMQVPDMVDHAGETCLFVIKNGQASGVTIGRATGSFSFVRTGNTGPGSMAWAIYNYGNESGNNSGVFSKPGDSGSIIVDGFGGIGGLLTGGTGIMETSDVTYATPMWWLWPRIKQHFPNASLYPTTIA